MRTCAGCDEPCSVLDAQGRCDGCASEEGRDVVGSGFLRLGERQHVALKDVHGIGVPLYYPSSSGNLPRSQVRCYVGAGDVPRHVDYFSAETVEELLRRAARARG